MHVFTGIVKQGTKRAAGLGFPTVNILLPDSDISGVYAAEVEVGTQKYHAAAFADPERELLEAYILDFPAQGGPSSGGSGELYGKDITIELHTKLRESMAFENDDMLRAAIARDVGEVRAYFKV